MSEDQIIALLSSKKVCGAPEDDGQDGDLYPFAVLRIVTLSSLLTKGVNHWRNQPVGVDISPPANACGVMSFGSS